MHAKVTNEQGAGFSFDCEIGGGGGEFDTARARWRVKACPLKLVAEVVSEKRLSLSLSLSYLLS